jgi:hypothetical protein
LAQALVGRRVGEQVDVDAPAGRYRCRTLATGRHQTAAASWRRTSSWVTEGGRGYVRPLPAWDGPLVAAAVVTAIISDLKDMR